MWEKQALTRWYLPAEVRDPFLYVNPPLGVLYCRSTYGPGSVSAETAAQEDDGEEVTATQGVRGVHVPPETFTAYEETKRRLLNVGDNTADWATAEEIKRLRRDRWCSLLKEILWRAL